MEPGIVNKTQEFQLYESLHKLTGGTKQYGINVDGSLHVIIAVHAEDYEPN